MGAFGQEFQNLSLQDKDAYLRDSSPTFKEMSPKDQSDYLNEVHYSGSRAPQPPPKDTSTVLGGIKSELTDAAKAFSDPREYLMNAADPLGIARSVASHAPLIGRAAGDVYQSMRHPLTEHPLTALHVGEAFAPGGEMAADLENRPLHEAIGRGITRAAPLAVGELWHGMEPVRNSWAERIAGSRVGVVPKNVLDISEPEPAMVKEGMVSLTPKREIRNYQNKISEYNDTVQNALRQAAPAPPENFHAIVDTATSRLIRLARENGNEAVARSIENWRDNYISQHPQNLRLDELYERKQQLGKEGGAFKGGPTEDVGAKAAKQEVVTAINERIGQRIPGLRDITQRESGLITARNMLSNRARVAKGSPLLPNIRTILGFGGESGFGGVSIHPNLPGETLAKSLLVKGLGTRVPLAPPVIPSAQPLLQAGNPPIGQLGIGQQGTTGFAPSGMFGRPPVPAPAIGFEPTTRAMRKGLLLESGASPQTQLNVPRGTVEPPIGPITVPPSPLSPIGGSEPTPTGGARGFPSTPQPNVRFGGSVRGVQGEYPPFEGQYVGQEPPPRGFVVNALPLRRLGPGVPAVEAGVSGLPQALARRAESAGTVPRTETFATMPPAEALRPSGGAKAPEEPIGQGSGAAALQRDAMKAQEQGEREAALRGNPDLTPPLSSKLDVAEVPKSEPVKPMRAKKAVEKVQVVLPNEAEPPTLQERAEAAKVANAARKEKPLPGTGLTRSQTDYLGGKIDEVKANLPAKAIQDGARVIVRQVGKPEWEGTIRGEALKGGEKMNVVPVDKKTRGSEPIAVYVSQITPKEGAVIKVPGDGTFKVPSVEAATALKKKIATGNVG